MYYVIFSWPVEFKGFSFILETYSSVLMYITSPEEPGILRKILSMLGKILGLPSGPFHAIIGAFTTTSDLCIVNSLFFSACRIASSVVKTLAVALSFHVTR